MGNPTNSIVELISDVYVVRGIHKDRARSVQSRTSCEAAITGKTSCGTTCHGRNVARRNLADAVIPLIRNVEIARLIERHTERVVQSGARRGPAIAKKA